MERDYPSSLDDSSGRNSGNNLKMTEKHEEDSRDIALEDQQDYPHGLRLAVIMIGLCLCVFCVALDSEYSTIKKSFNLGELANKHLRRYHHRDSNSRNHRQLPLTGRHWLVLERLPSLQCRLPALLRQAVLHLSHQMGVHDCPCHL